MPMGGWEWVIIAVVALLLFGGARIAGIGKNAGKAIHDFKDELHKGENAAATEAGAASSEPADPAAN
jgi:sec-independent protein translocase protein TatA